MNNRLIYMMLLNAIFIMALAQSTIVSTTYAESQAENEAKEQERGPKGGKVFRDGDFALELTIFEQGVPPQFRIYAYENDEPINPAEVKLSIELHRLDGEVNRFAFTSQDDVLIGNGVVTEPHSFDVKMTAIHKGETHNWEFASYEGRTKISDTAAQEANVKTEIAGTGTIAQYAHLTGRITLNRNSTAQVRARFPGIVKSVKAMWGQKVKKGDVLAKVESNQSLNTFNVVSPVDGIIMERNTNVGDVAGDNALFTIADLSEVWAKFHVFPSDLATVKQDQVVHVQTLGSVKKEQSQSTKASISMLLPTADQLSQTVLAIVPLDNTNGEWRPGMIVEGDVLVSEKKVPLVVKTSALQQFRDFTVVFAKIGDTYEVRMLELGANDGEFVEVLEGLKPGTEYVTENSFLIKADIEKSGARHDH
jgi:membrane fusion protein, heavy metal efflux system